MQFALQDRYHAQAVTDWKNNLVPFGVLEDNEAQVPFVVVETEYHRPVATEVDKNLASVVTGLCTRWLVELGEGR